MNLGEWTTKLEHLWENEIIFRARWLLAPAYFVLILGLALLTLKTIQEFIELLLHFYQYDESRTTAQILVIVDIILVMNLILMVLFVGYANFVSVIHPDKEEDWPKWMGYLDYSGLKIQLIGSIIAISGIKLLRVFVDMTDTTVIDYNRIILMIALHLTFVVSALILAIVNKLREKSD